MCGTYTVYKIEVGKYEREIILGEPARILKGNITEDLK
jgi:hypothetical protein